MEMFLTIKLCTYAKLNCLIEQIIYIKMNLALNNLQRLICHKTKPNQAIYFTVCIFLTPIQHQVLLSNTNNSDKITGPIR